MKRKPIPKELIDPEYLRCHPEGRRHDDEPVKLKAETWESWHRKMGDWCRRMHIRISTWIGPVPASDNCDICRWYYTDLVISMQIETVCGKINVDICRKCAETISSKIDGILVNPNLRVNKGGNE